MSDPSPGAVHGTDALPVAGARDHVVASIGPRTDGAPATGAAQRREPFADLRDGVTAYVQRLRDDGVPSERALVFVKSAMREATPPELSPVEQREMMEAVVRWSVQAYYATDPR